MQRRTEVNDFHFVTEISITHWRIQHPERTFYYLLPGIFRDWIDIPSSSGNQNRLRDRLRTQHYFRLTASNLLLCWRQNILISTTAGNDKARNRNPCNIANGNKRISLSFVAADDKIYDAAMCFLSITSNEREHDHTLIMRNEQNLVELVIAARS